jgi:hypothetical protein
MRRIDRPARLVTLQYPTELHQQRLQLRTAAVHVADDVERPGDLPLVVPGPLVRDGDVVWVGDDVNLPEPLPAQATQ